MNNRFVRAIRSGDIDTIESLKSEFKRLAKLTHPDLLVTGEPAEDFIRVRNEYEKALAEFERYRYGFGARAGASRTAFDRAAFYSSLVALFKRGFPKTPRHEKERLRYEYARYLTLAQARAWSGARGLLFEGFESALIGAKAEGGKRFDAILDAILGVVEYHEKGAPLIRVGVKLQCSLLVRNRSPDPAIRLFLELLVEDMDEGPALRRGRG